MFTEKEKSPVKYLPLILQLSGGRGRINIPVLTTIKYFRDEYEAHIKEKKCPAKKCSALISYNIVADKCKGCSLCSKKCPVNAISGVIKTPYKIDNEACVRCGQCIENCKFGAIEILSGEGAE